MGRSYSFTMERVSMPGSSGCPRISTISPSGSGFSGSPGPETDNNQLTVPGPSGIFRGDVDVPGKSGIVRFHKSDACTGAIDSDNTSRAAFQYADDLAFGLSAAPAGNAGYDTVAVQPAAQAPRPHEYIRGSAVATDKSESVGIDAEQTRGEIEPVRGTEAVVAQPDDSAFPFELDEQATKSPVVVFGHSQRPAQFARFERAARFFTDEIQNPVAGYGHGDIPSRSRRS